MIISLNNHRTRHEGEAEENERRGVSGVGKEISGVVCDTVNVNVCDLCFLGMRSEAGRG